MDSELLIKLVAIQSSYTEDKAINDFIIKKISTISGVTVERDKFGNIYATKGSGAKGYKCIVAHTDTVHQIYANRKIFIYDNILFAMRKGKSYSYDSEAVAATGIGGDDKCGVYTCIKALEDFDNIKAVFFRFEESGCKGSSASNISFFSDCNFIVQCDRKGNSDFITHTNGIDVASNEFEQTMSEIYKSKGYSTAIGSSTDVGTLKRMGVEVSCVNLSSGYYGPHTAGETINLTDLQNCYDLVTEMFTKHGETRFEHKYKPIVYNSTRSIYLPKESAFTFSISRNFFATRLSVEIESVMSEEPLSFINIPGTKKYKLVFDEYIYFNENVACPKCSALGSITYFTESSTFFCDGNEHKDYLIDNNMYRHCVYEDNENVFVYNRIYDIWYKQEDAVYDMVLNVYKLKEELTY